MWNPISPNCSAHVHPDTRLLVVDGDEFNREVMVCVREELGLQLDAAENG